MKKASELEATVLGHVWKHGPCTPYSVRKHFLESPTSRFSGSAGAIYPLVGRLEDRGLLRSRATATGKREGRALEISQAGRAALRAWLSSPLDAEEAGTHDPLRSKALFLGALTPRQRSRWMDRSEAALAAQERRLKEHLAAYADEADPFFEIASWNALGQLRARRAWIRRARRALARVGRGGGARARARRRR